MTRKRKAKAKTPRVKREKTEKREFVLRAKIFSALRRLFRNSPYYSEPLNKAKSEYFKKAKNGNDMRRVHFKCASCGKMFDKKEVNVDHIDPVVPPEGLPTCPNGEPDYNVYVNRLFCHMENLQIVCLACHQIKSNNEQKLRRSIKKIKKLQTSKESTEKCQQSTTIVPTMFQSLSTSQGSNRQTKKRSKPSSKKSTKRSASRTRRT